jgi:oxygen-independent coproporphyrinogen-3 oxidase
MVEAWHMAQTRQFIYVHVPFCEQKCAYCDFFTITDPDGKHPLARTWLDLCAREAELWLDAGDMDRTKPIKTIFFGGGTPSLLEPVAYAGFFARIKQTFAFAPDVEITLETQPGTVDAHKLQAYAHAGFNRFSIGVQSFDDRFLLPTGRRHNAEQSRATIHAAAATGKLVSIDLISALPGQTIGNWRTELDEALSFSPDHISVYELTFHEGTQYFRDMRAGRLTEADEDTRIAMFEHTRQRLTAAGYEHYEISNYARPGARSLHNQNYWQLGDYAGLGAGAHSLVFPNRYANPNAASDYARTIQSGRLFRRPSNTSDSDVFLAENLQMALRNLDGVNLDQLSEKFGRDILAEKEHALAELEQNGLIQLAGSTLRLTATGELQSDSIVSKLL